MSAVANKYTFFVGTARGILQYTSCIPEVKIKYELTEESSEITALEWGRTENEVVIGYKKGHISFYDSSSNKYVSSCEELEGSDAVVGVGAIGSSVIVGRQDGIINVWNSDGNEFFSLDLNENSTLECIQVHKNRKDIVGTGGESNDFKLWNVETHQCVFRAKSLGHDELNLPIPTTVRGISFFPEDERLSVCATREGYVLLYDDRAQRRPVVKFFEKKASYTAVASAYRERQCLVGTTKGYMQLLDMKAGKCIKTFKSFAGSVTSIVCDPTEPYVASTSLDRYLRVHHLDTKELVYKNYMKQNLTKILMKPIVKEEPEEKEHKVSSEVAEIDEEYEEIFDKMETVSEIKSEKRKSHTKEHIIGKKKKKIK